MKLEQQVVSLELAKKLKELGVKQESLFWWTTNNLNFTDEKCTWWIEPTVESYTRRISAFTVAELGEMLPTRYKKTVYHSKNIPSNNEYEHDFVIAYGKSIRPKRAVVGEVYEGGMETYFYCYSFPSAHSPQHLQEAAVRFEANTEADARALMLIYLIENNLLDPNQITL